MTALTDAEHEGLLKSLMDRLRWPSMHWGIEDVHPDAWTVIIRDTIKPAVESILAARLAEQAEQLATAMAEEFADRVEWGDGTQYIAVSDAARIAREVTA